MLLGASDSFRIKRVAWQNLDQAVACHVPSLVQSSGNDVLEELQVLCASGVSR